MRTSEKTDKLSVALVSAINDLHNPVKSVAVRAGQRRYSFAPLPDILDDVRPILFARGLALLQEACTVDGHAAVGTRIVHVSGEWVEYEPLQIPSASDAQSIGSAITYARRYALSAALGIAADEDDDGAKTKRPGSDAYGEGASGPGDRPEGSAPSPGAEAPSGGSSGAGVGTPSPAPDPTSGGSLDAPAREPHDHVPGPRKLSSGKFMCVTCGEPFRPEPSTERKVEPEPTETLV
ncbi:MAG: ERF family protein [Actinomycetota bacterium]